MDGILNLDKPAGVTSFKMVARIASITGERTGHGGTLDPFATGVLPLLIGQARRLSEFLLTQPKQYRAVMAFGVETDTLDVTGSVKYDAGWSHITPGSIEETLGKFTGRISQVPPAFSALKIDGRRSYRLARQGESREPAERMVDIYSLEIISYRPPLLTIDVRCGRGTYIRSLARDIGRSLGSVATLESLSRTAYGPFELADSITLEQAEAAGSAGLAELLLPMDCVLAHLPRVELGPEEEKTVCQGQFFEPPDPLPPGLYRAYGRSGRLVALVEKEAEQHSLKPKKVFGKAGLS